MTYRNTNVELPWPHFWSTVMHRSQNIYFCPKNNSSNMFVCYKGMTFITCLTNQIGICRVPRSPSPPPHRKSVLVRANLNPAVKPEGFVTVLFYLIIFRPHVMMAWPPTLFSSNLGGLECIGSKGTKSQKSFKSFWFIFLWKDLWNSILLFF